MERSSRKIFCFTARAVEVSGVHAEWKKSVEMLYPELVASFVFVNRVISTDEFLKIMKNRYRFSLREHVVTWTHP